MLTTWFRTMLRSRASGLLVVTALALAPCMARASSFQPARPETVGFSTERLGRLDAKMEALVASGHAPGATVLIARHGKIVFFKAYGKADLASGAPVTRDSIFRVYSQTKAVTGVALMMLFEEGRWRMDDPVTKFAPELANLKVYKATGVDGVPLLENAARAPTMRELLTHTAGFGYGLSSDNPVDALYAQSGVFQSRSAVEFLQRVGQIPMASQPGAEWRYSIGVDIQGYIVERLSGQTLSEFMRSRIFLPLGMSDTAFYVPPEKLSRLVTLYSVDSAGKRLKAPNGVLVRDFAKPPVIASGGAGLVSTTLDYARFTQMLLNGGTLDGSRLLAPATVALMGSNLLSDAVLSKGGGYSAASGRGFGVDLAIVTDKARAGTLQGRGTMSWGGAAGSWFWLDPENDVVVLGMLQVMNGWEDPELAHVSELAATLVYQALVDPAR